MRLIRNISVHSPVEQSNDSNGVRRLIAVTAATGILAGRAPPGRFPSEMTFPHFLHYVGPVSSLF